MKRLLCILSSMNAGGAETFLMKLYRNIDRSYFQMDFCINSKDKQFYEDEIYRLGGKIFRIPSKSEDFHIFKKSLFNVVRDNRYEYVLRVTSNAMGFLDLKIAHDAGARVCAARSSNAGGDDSIIGMVAHLFGRLFYEQYVNRKMAPSDLAAIYTFGRRAYRGGEVCMLRNALDLDYYKYDDAGRTSVRRQLGILDNAKVVGHVGRFQKQKNHKFLLRVFAELCKIRKDVVLLLVGKGELEDNARRLAQELDILDNVVFAGVRKDIPQVLSAMDVLVMPSFYEGMPNVVVEAQATGLPCVISDTITHEANITGLVKYLSLRMDLRLWANVAMQMMEEPRKDTKAIFLKNGYDIKSVASQFVSLIVSDKVQNDK